MAKQKRIMESMIDTFYIGRSKKSRTDGRLVLGCYGCI